VASLPQLPRVEAFATGATKRRTRPLRLCSATSIRPIEAVRALIAECARGIGASVVAAAVLVAAAQGRSSGSLLEVGDQRRSSDRIASSTRRAGATLARPIDANFAGVRPRPILLRRSTRDRTFEDKGYGDLGTHDILQRAEGSVVL